MILHTVNKSPAMPVLANCLRFLADEDALLLLEDGVYGAIHGDNNNSVATAIDAGIAVYAIEADITARGLGGRLIEGVQLIDYAGFVDLCANHSSVKNWF